jgi:hypothetical protein
MKAITWTENVVVQGQKCDTITVCTQNLSEES